MGKSVNGTRFNMQTVTTNAMKYCEKFYEGVKTRNLPEDFGQNYSISVTPDRTIFTSTIENPELRNLQNPLISILLYTYKNLKLKISGTVNTKNIVCTEEDERLAKTQKEFNDLYEVVYKDRHGKNTPRIIDEQEIEKRPKFMELQGMIDKLNAIKDEKYRRANPTTLNIEILDGDKQVGSIASAQTQTSETAFNVKANCAGPKNLKNKTFVMVSLDGETSAAQKPDPTPPYFVDYKA